VIGLLVQEEHEVDEEKVLKITFSSNIRPEEEAGIPLFSPLQVRDGAVTAHCLWSKPQGRT